MKISRLFLSYSDIWFTYITNTYIDYPYSCFIIFSLTLIVGGIQNNVRKTSEFRTLEQTYFGES